jgi:type II secretory pathway pseudopilin PulG
MIEMMTVVAVMAIVTAMVVVDMKYTDIKANIKKAVEVAEMARVASTKSLLENNTCPDDFIQGVGGKYLDKIVREYDVTWNKCKVSIILKDGSSIPEKVRGKRVDWVLNLDDPNKVWTCTSSLPDEFSPSNCSFSG